MAGQAAKKQKKISEQYSKYFIWVAAAINAFYLLYNLFYDDLLTLWNISILAFHSLVTYLMLKAIMSCLEEGTNYTYYQDFLSCFTVWVWLIYLFIPIYAIFKLKNLYSSMFPQGMDQEPQMTKTQMKKQKKAEKFGHTKQVYKK